MLDREFVNRDISIAITITGLIALKIPKASGMNGWRLFCCPAQACLRVKLRLKYSPDWVRSGNWYQSYWTTIARNGTVTARRTVKGRFQKKNH